MTDTPWTPGPWRVNPRASTNVEAPNFRGVASTGSYRDSISNGAYAVENDANARLIAAAPDMAEALAQLLIEYDEVDLAAAEPPSFTAAVLAARAALAKARGQL